MKGKTIRKLTFQSQIISKHVRPSNTSKYQWSREQITMKKLGMSQIPTSLPDFREYAKQIPHIAPHRPGVGGGGGRGFNW